ncbi:hypothetical protein GW17_00046017 [Ensete ventricosum]|nr:hypothetical protein GW17_00046017 [Ensete ventricosum]
MGAQDSSLALEGCASSSEHRLVGREPRRSPSVKVDFWFLAKLQPPGVCYDVSGRVACPQSRNLIWLAFIGGVYLFTSASFHSSAGSPIVDACTKVVVERGEVPP